MFIKLTVALSLTGLHPAWAATSVGEGVVKAPVVTASPSINPAAQQGKSSQSGGSMANMMAGMALMAACMATQPPNVALCMMGAMAMAQSGEDDNAANQSAATQMATNTSGPTSTNPNSTAKPVYQAIDDSSASLADKQAAKAGLKTLADAGYKVTPAGIQGSDGSTIPAAAFNSAGGMTAAGLDPAQAEKAQEVAARVSADMSKYKTMGAVAEGVGGGGPGGPVGEETSSGDSKPAGFVNPFAISDKAKGEMIAGKTVTFDGEPIGVKGDNIFEMVHNAYARKTAGKHFIETDHDPELNRVRAPASVTRALPKLALPKK